MYWMTHEYPYELEKKSLNCVEILVIKERNSDVTIMKRQKTCTMHVNIHKDI